MPGPNTCIKNKTKQNKTQNMSKGSNWKDIFITPTKD